MTEQQRMLMELISQNSKNVEQNRKNILKIRSLIEEGVDPNFIDENGKSPLHIAAEQYSIVKLKALFQSNMFDVNIRDAESCTVFDNIEKIINSSEFHELTRLNQEKILHTKKCLQELSAKMQSYEQGKDDRLIHILEHIHENSRRFEECYGIEGTFISNSPEQSRELVIQMHLPDSDKRIELHTKAENKKILFEYDKENLPENDADRNKALDDITHLEKVLNRIR